MDTRRTRALPFALKTAAIAGCAVGALTVLPAHADIPASERAVLDALYAQTGGPSWTSNTRWETDSNLCSWHGLTCDEGGTHVIGIMLIDNALVGTLPAITALAELQTFDVDSNQLSGPMPAIADMAHLVTFDLAENRFSGSIPALDGLFALQSFDVRDNELTGSAPELSSLVALADFEIGGNQLTGAVPAPPPVNADRLAGSLCPNFLNPRQIPESPTDVYWDIVIDSNWDQGCTAAPVIVATAMPAPTLSTDALLLLAGLFGVGGCFALARHGESVRARRINHGD